MTRHLLFALLPLFGCVLWVGCGEPEDAPAPQAATIDSSAVHVRANLVGYRPDDAKVAIAFSHEPVEGSFSVRDAETDAVVHEGTVEPSEADGWGTFAHYYRLDFSDVTETGRYVVEVDEPEDRSPAFAIGPDAYGTAQEDLIAFMRQQRCGYNPFLEVVCHPRDRRTFFGPMPDSTFIEASGGWHDVGDQLKYLIMGSNATVRMLLAYEPVCATIYNQLRGLTLSEPDEFAPFQNDYVVYHDDIGDYSTNEPTMDGTAGAIYMMAHFGAPASR